MSYRHATRVHDHDLGIAIENLKTALHFAKRADCPKLADKIRSAIKSAGGAERNMRGRLMHYGT